MQPSRERYCDLLVIVQVGFAAWLAVIGFLLAIGMLLAIDGRYGGGEAGWVDFGRHVVGASAMLECVTFKVLNVEEYVWICLCWLCVG